MQTPVNVISFFLKKKKKTYKGEFLTLNSLEFYR